MAQAIFNLVDRTPTSSYEAYYGGSTSAAGLTNTSGQTITVPSYSIINWVKVYCTLGSPQHGTAVRQLQVDGDAAHAGFFSNGSSLTKTLFTPGNHSIRFVFKSAKNGTNYPSSPMGMVTNSSQLSIENISIVIDYNGPDTGGTVTTANASGLSLNKSVCKCGDILRLNILNQTPGVYHVARVGIYGSALIDEWTPKGRTYHDYEIPVGWQNYIAANGQTATAYARLMTYKDAARTQYVGYSLKDFTITLSDDNYPIITDFETIRIPGFADESITGYVQKYSQAFLSASAEALYGASISQYKVMSGSWVGYGAETVSPVMQTSGTWQFYLVVTDSRGRQSGIVKYIDVIPYSEPSLFQPTVYRSDENGGAAVSGGHVYIDAGITISSLGGVNAGTLKARVYEKSATPPAWDDVSVITMTPGTPVIADTPDVTISYGIDLLVTDKLASYLYHDEIPTSEALLTGIAESGVGIKGAGIGLFAEKENAVTARWPYYVNNDLVGVRKNLLHNPDFRNPVNQRNAGTGIPGSGQYFIDRWKLNSGWASVYTGAVVLTQDAVIEQRIEGLYLAGKIVTATVWFEGSVYHIGTGTFPTSAGTATVSLSGGGTVTLGYNANYMYFRFQPPAGNDVGILGIKLELGSYSTMEADPPIDYAVELLKCQRFYRYLVSNAPVGYWLGDGYTYFKFDHPFYPPMRVNPSPVITYLHMGGVGDLNVGAMSPAVGVSTTGLESIRITRNASVGASNYLYFFGSISADL